MCMADDCLGMHEPDEDQIPGQMVLPLWDEDPAPRPKPPETPAEWCEWAGWEGLL